MARRKPTGQFERVAVAYKLPRWLVDWLKEADKPATRLVEEALCRAYDLAPPVDPVEVEQLLQDKQRIAARLEQLLQGKQRIAAQLEQLGVGSDD